MEHLLEGLESQISRPYSAHRYLASSGLRTERPLSKLSSPPHIRLEDHAPPLHGRVVFVCRCFPSDKLPPQWRCATPRHRHTTSHHGEYLDDRLRYSYQVPR